MPLHVKLQVVLPGEGFVTLSTWMSIWRWKGLVCDHLMPCEIIFVFELVITGRAGWVVVTFEIPPAFHFFSWGGRFVLKLVFIQTAKVSLI